MELKRSGTVVIEEASCRFTEMGRWSVSRSGTFIGEVDTLAEVPGLIERRKTEVLARLAKVTAEAERRKAEREAERAAVDAASKPDANPFAFSGPWPNES